MRWWRSSLVRPLVALALLAVREGPAGAQAPPALGAIRGRVEVQREVGGGESSPNVADLGMAPRREGPDRRQSVVYLATAPQGAFEEHPSLRASLDQKDEAFVPYVLPILAGTTVDFPNRDKTYHNVFSLSKVTSFDLGRYARGQSKAVRFDTPGVIRVFCDIHSHMSAYILVFAHRFFAATDPEGRYHIDGVPAGSYEVVVWTDGRVRETRQARVPEGGTVDVDFLVR